MTGTPEGRFGDFDRAFAEAATLAAATLSRLPGKSYVLESQLEDALIAALKEIVPPVVASPRRRRDVPGWEGRLGAVDIVVVDEHDQLLAAAELKIDSIWQTLWDIYKLVALVGDRVPAYCGIIAPSARFARDVDCVEFFGDRPRQHETVAVVHANEKAWRDLLAGGPARPVEVPAAIESRPIASVPLAAEPSLELRVIGVRAVPDAGTVAFVDGWPVHV